MVKVRDGAHVVNKAAHLVVGVDTDGIKHVLGIWVQSVEGAKFCLAVLTELRNRGVRDALIACCEAWKACPRRSRPSSRTPSCRPCVVHLIRASLRYVSYNDRKQATALLKMIYTAAHELLDDIGRCFTDQEVRRRLHIRVEPSHPQRIVGTDRHVQQEATRTGLKRRHQAAVAEHRRVNAMRKLAQIGEQLAGVRLQLGQKHVGDLTPSVPVAGYRSFAISATASRCTLSWMSGSIRRRSVSCAATIRARERSSSASCSLRCAASRTLAIAVAACPDNVASSCRSAWS